MAKSTMACPFGQQFSIWKLLQLNDLPGNAQNEIWELEKMSQPF
jgi:hypothetical protein